MSTSERAVIVATLGERPADDAAAVARLCAATTWSVRHARRVLRDWREELDAAEAVERAKALGVAA